MTVQDPGREKAEKGPQFSLTFQEQQLHPLVSRGDPSYSLASVVSNSSYSSGFGGGTKRHDERNRHLELAFLMDDNYP